MIRKAICAVVAFGITTVVVFTLNLLWVGDRPVVSLLVSLLGGALSVLAVLTAQRKDPLDDDKMPRWARVLLFVLGVLLLVGMAVWDIYEHGVAEGVTRCVVLALTILSSAASHYFCTNR